MKHPPSYAFVRESGRDEEPALCTEYLEAIARLEAMAENQSGADKTWVEEAIRGFAQHYVHAKRVR